MVDNNMRNSLKGSLTVADVENIEWTDSKYYPSVRTKEHTLSCTIHGEPVVLTYEVSWHDGGEEGFTIHSEGEDIWDMMPESELRKLEQLLHEAVEYGHWIDYLDQAKTLEAVREVRYSLYETEELTREQIQALHKAIDDKEALLRKAERGDLDRKSVLIDLENKKSRMWNEENQSSSEQKQPKNECERG